MPERFWLVNPFRGEDFLYNRRIFNTGNNLYFASTLFTLLYFYGEDTLQSLDEANHLIAYSLTRGQPLGMTEYVVSISLRASADGCDMKWEGEFDAAPEVNAEELASNLKHAYEGMTELFERFVGN